MAIFLGKECVAGRFVPDTVSATFGEGTTDSKNGQLISGKYNEEDTNSALIIGGGKSDTERKNLFTVGWDGVGTFLKDVVVGVGAGKISLVELNNKWGKIPVNPTAEEKANYNIWIEE